MRAWLSAIALVIGLGLASAARDQSAAFQACMGRQTAYSNTQQPIKPPSDVVVPIFQRWPIAFRCTGAFLDENNAAITAVATLIIAIFTIVLTGVSDRQARLTKEALIADKRAFVFASSLHPNWERNKETGECDWRFRPSWKNSGDTPTKSLTLYTDGELRNTQLPSNFSFDSQSAAPGTGLIPPGGESAGGAAPHPPGAAITPQDIIDMQAGRKYFYLWGWVKYHDIFPRTPQHITRFCWVILPLGNPKTFRPGQKPGDPDSLTFNWLHNTEGNSADEDG